MRLFSFIIILTTEFIFSSVIGNTKWTIMNYGHADHNLSEEYIIDMLEMQKVGSSDDFKIINQVDLNINDRRAKKLWKKKYNIDPEQFDGVKRILLTKSTNQFFSSQILESLPESNNMDDPKTLSEFILWSVNNFPADRYGLILWNHGKQFIGFGGDSQNGTNSKFNYLTTDEIRRSIKKVINSNELNKFDFISFDSCMMGGAEILIDFHDLCNVFIACPELDFGSGWDYTSTLNYLKQNPNVNIIDFAKNEVKHWNSHHNHGIDVQLKAHAAYDTSRYFEYDFAFKKFVEAINELGTDQIQYVTQVRTEITNYSVNQRSQRGVLTDFIDIGQFAKNLSDKEISTNLTNCSKDLFEAIENMVIAKSLGSHKLSASGLSITYPLNKKSWENYDDIYTNLNFCESTGSDWLVYIENKITGKDIDNVSPLLFAGHKSWNFALFSDDNMDDVESVEVGNNSSAVIDIITFDKNLHQLIFSLIKFYETEESYEFIYLSEISRHNSNIGDGEYVFEWGGRVPMITTEESDYFYILPSWPIGTSQKQVFSYINYQPPNSNEIIELYVLISYDENGVGKVVNILESAGVSDSNGSWLSFPSKSNIELESGGKIWPVYQTLSYDKEFENELEDNFILEDFFLTVPDSGLSGIKFGYSQANAGDYFLVTETVDYNSNYSDILLFNVNVIEEDEIVIEPSKISTLKKTERKNILQPLDIFINHELNTYKVQWEIIEGLKVKLQKSYDYREWKDVSFKDIKKNGAYDFYSENFNQKMIFFRLIYD